MAQTLRKVAKAADTRKPLLLSTPNLNFVAHSLADEEFRESLLASDLCTADGMPVVWIARALGVPIRDRVAGSDLFAELKLARLQKRPLSVFFFGGAGAAASTACHRLNGSPSVLMRCAGCLNPGHGSVEALSEAGIIEAINASRADLLCVALGAAKGQGWLLRNHEQIKVPVRAHLGAVVNFQAGTARRAPKLMQKLGLEWLWRIKEEPYLWKRYCKDGLLRLRLLACNVIPILARQRWHGFRQRDSACEFDVERSQDDGSLTLWLRGDAVAQHITTASAHFRGAMTAAPKRITLDLSLTRYVDARFIGLLMMLRKLARERATQLQIVGASPYVRLLFRLHAAAYLLAKGSCP
jgi:N-acetylglucosaminyldiphosphoundecaprenol N-acetyl-beta-D-mannosaminyltransferase